MLPVGIDLQRPFSGFYRSDLLASFFPRKRKGRITEYRGRENLMEIQVRKRD